MIIMQKGLDLQDDHEKNVDSIFLLRVDELRILIRVMISHS